MEAYFQTVVIGIKTSNNQFTRICFWVKKHQMVATGDQILYGLERPFRRSKTHCPISKKADACIIIGTSMQVYPAAGLTQYLPRYADIFILDLSNPPANNSSSKVHYITKKATEGIDEVIDMLKSKWL